MTMMTKGETPMRPLKSLPKGRYISLRARPMFDPGRFETPPTARQEGIPGFNQDVVCKSGIFFCGAGGLFAEQGPGVVRKGYGRIVVTDMDSFEPTNYPRQFCYPQNLFKNKGVEVAKNLQRESVLGTSLLGLGLPFLDALECVNVKDFHVGVCNVDNNETRRHFSVVFREAGVPAIFCGVSGDAGNGYVYVQEATGPDAACWGCAFPHKANDLRQPCPNTPACKDILKVLGGYVLYAIDSLLMPRPRNWNMRQVFLDGFVPDAATVIERNPRCPLCGEGAGHTTRPAGV